MRSPGPAPRASVRTATAKKTGDFASIRPKWLTSELIETTTFQAIYDTHAGDVYRFARYLTASDDAAADITALVPGEAGRRYVDRAIYDEMVKNRFLPETRTALLGIIDELRSQGAQAVVLGCTEIPLLIRPDDCPLPMYDTLAIHAAAGVEFMVG